MYVFTKQYSHVWTVFCVAAISCNSFSRMFSYFQTYVLIFSDVCVVIFRLHNTSAECYQTGYVEAGALYWHASEMGQCPGGLPKGNDWFKVSNSLKC